MCQNSQQHQNQSNGLKLDGKGIFRAPAARFGQKNTEIFARLRRVLALKNIKTSPAADVLLPKIQIYRAISLCVWTRDLGGEDPDLPRKTTFFAPAAPVDLKFPLKIPKYFRRDPKMDLRNARLKSLSRLAHVAPKKTDNNRKEI